MTIHHQRSSMGISSTFFTQTLSTRRKLRHTALNERTEENAGSPSHRPEKKIRASSGSWQARRMKTLPSGSLTRNGTTVPKENEGLEPLSTRYFFKLQSAHSLWSLLTCDYRVSYSSTFNSKGYVFTVLMSIEQSLTAYTDLLPEVRCAVCFSAVALLLAACVGLTQCGIIASFLDSACAYGIHGISLSATATGNNYPGILVAY